MLISMTGCGSAILSIENHQIEVEVQSLNSKFFDCSVRLARFFSKKELFLRKLLAEVFLRGKVSLSIQCSPVDGSPVESDHVSASAINEVFFKRYWQDLEEVLAGIPANPSQDALLRAVMRMPAILQSAPTSQVPQVPVEKLWEAVQEALKRAIEDCQAMQIEEGSQIQVQIFQEMAHIEAGLAEVLRMEPDRNNFVRKKVQSRAQEALGAHYAEGRMLQELFFYVERMDFTEEKERLEQHIRFFKDLLQEKKTCEAKRLLFVVQEIGRELNTLGTKSHHAGIQRQIVDMKSALEKIKEQLQNIK